MLFPYYIPIYEARRAINYICLYYIKVKTPYKLLVNPHWSYQTTPIAKKSLKDNKYFINCGCNQLYEFVYVPNLKTDAFAMALIVHNKPNSSLYYIKNQTRDLVIAAVDNQSGLSNAEIVDDEIIIKAIRIDHREFFNLYLNELSLDVCKEYITIIANEGKPVKENLNNYIPDNIKKNKEFQRRAIDLGFLHLLPTAT